MVKTESNTGTWFEKEEVAFLGLFVLVGRLEMMVEVEFALVTVTVSTSLIPTPLSAGAGLVLDTLGG